MPILRGKHSDKFLKDINSTTNIISIEIYKEIDEAYDNMTEEFLTIQELSNRLDENITLIYNIIYDNEIKNRKKGREFGYCLSEVQKLLGE